MANNKIVIGGIEEFAAMPREIEAKAAPLTKEGAETARERIRAAYPRITGRLQDGVVVKAGRSGSGVTQHLVTSTAPYAMHYEFGTVHQRARPTFYPIARREQKATTKEVVTIVRAVPGFTVTGDDV